jgi:hemin uptake protein HemP
MSEMENRPHQKSRPPQTTPALPVLRTEELFQGQREICIEHDGKRYRLRITRRNKLILQK